MKRLKHLLIVAMMTAIPFLVTGCGGGGGGSSSGESGTRSAQIGTGYYVDSAVSGVDYVCGSQRGVTDDQGTFRFEVGKACRFTINGILLRIVGAEQLTNADKPVVVLEDNVTVAAFLQTLDADRNLDNGIEINQTVKDALRDVMAEEGYDEVPQGLERLVELRTKLDNDFEIELDAKSEEEAKAHLRETKRRYSADPQVRLIATNDLDEDVQNTLGGSETAGNDGNVSNESGTPLEDYTLKALDDDAFNALNAIDKVYVAKKLYATLYKGVDYKTIQSQIASGHFISDFKHRIETNVAQPDLDKIIPPDEELNRDNTGGGDAIKRKLREAQATVLSRLMFTKLDKRYYSDWMAYKLNQTILLSPGWEVDSMQFYPRFILSNFDRLRKWIYQNESIKTIVKRHMVSVENWARFRSPEDNGREMMEIWLQDFDDSHVPIAARALKNWKFYSYYESPYQKYYFSEGKGDESKTDTVTLYGKTLRTGNDFFDAVIAHPNFMPTVVTRIVNRFFPTFTQAQKEDITQRILADHPVTFKDIFDRILFSKAYLLRSDKVKSAEETILGTLNTLGYDFTKMSFDGREFIAPESNLALLAALPNMNQRTMYYKLGREDKVPVDTVSMNEYAQYARLLFAHRDVATGLDARYDHSSLRAFLDGMFVDVLGRHITDHEYDVLSSYYKNTPTYQGHTVGEVDNDNSRWVMVVGTLDYFTRLAEFYQYRKVQE